MSCYIEKERAYLLGSECTTRPDLISDVISDILTMTVSERVVTMRENDGQQLRLIVQKLTQLFMRYRNPLLFLAPTR